MSLRIALPSDRVRPSVAGFRSLRSTEVISQVSCCPSSPITTTCSLRITAAHSGPARVEKMLHGIRHEHKILDRHFPPVRVHPLQIVHAPAAVFRRRGPTSTRAY